jgi:hypothetical protein
VNRFVVAIAEDLDVHPLELAAAALWTVLVVPFIFGLVVGILIAGVTA